MACKPILHGILWNLGYSLFDKDFNYTASRERWLAEFDALEELHLKKIMKRILMTNLYLEMNGLI